MRYKDISLMNKIKKFAEEFFISEGHSPSTTDIANSVGSSRGTVHRYLVEMNEKGLISYDGKTIKTEITEKVPCGCETVYWDYFATNEKRYDAMMRSSKNLSPRVWFSGGAWTWGSFAPNNKYSIGRNSVAIPCAIKNAV